MTQANSNKTLIRHFIKAMWEKDRNAVMSSLNEEVRWHLPRALSYNAGELTSANAVADLLTGDVLDQLYYTDTIIVSEDYLLADDQHASYQYTMSCKTRQDTQYDNTIVLSFAIEDGKIVEAWEHMDTLHLSRVVLGK